MAGLHQKQATARSKEAVAKASIGISLHRLTIERAGSLARKGGLSLSEWLEAAAWVAINRAEDEAEARPRGTR